MDRRNVLKILAMMAASPFIPINLKLLSATPKLILKKIPSSKEDIPAIGMGTWITFNVGSSKKLRDERVEVLRAFFQNGGTLVDSSPMYGSSEEVMGYALKKLGKANQVFAATKIWTGSSQEGKDQLQDSLKLWGVNKLELEQVHNLVGVDSNLKYLREQKEKGKVKYIGITTSHGRRHDEVIKLMKTEPLDFVQLTYNAKVTEAEKNILSLAQDKGIGVIANRPYEGGSLIDSVQKEKLPTWARDKNIQNWPELLLKFIISHPAITCAIPATTKVEHMNENMKACYGELLDESTRLKVQKYVSNL